MNVSNEWAMLWSYKLVSLGASYFSTEFCDRDFSNVIKQSNAALDLGRECNSFEKSLGCRWEREGRSNKFGDFSLKPYIFFFWGLLIWSHPHNRWEKCMGQKKLRNPVEDPKKEYNTQTHTHTHQFNPTYSCHI